MKNKVCRQTYRTYYTVLGNLCRRDFVMRNFLTRFSYVKSLILGRRDSLAQNSTAQYSTCYILLRERAENGTCHIFELFLLSTTNYCYVDVSTAGLQSLMCMYPQTRPRLICLFYSWNSNYVMSLFLFLCFGFCSLLLLLLISIQVQTLNSVILGQRIASGTVVV